MDDLRESKHEVDDLKVLLTAVGCPGGVTMIKALQKEGVTVIGTDMYFTAAGRFFADQFCVVPGGRSEGYIPAMQEIISIAKPDLIFPQSSYEVLALSTYQEELGIPIIVSSPESINLCNDKGLLYAALYGKPIPIPNHYVCNNLAEFIEAELKFPVGYFCYKPTCGKGGRGFRVFDDRYPDIGDYPLMVMEVIEGTEYAVDVFCDQGEILMGFIKTRENIKDGLAMKFQVVDRPDLWSYAEIIAKTLNLDGFADIQFKGDYLLEVNPRVSSFVHQENFNMPYLGILYTLGEIGKDELREASKRVRFSRRSVRYYDQVFYDIARTD